MLDCEAGNTPSPKSPGILAQQLRLMRRVSFIYDWGKYLYHHIVPYYVYIIRLDREAMTDKPRRDFGSRMTILIGTTRCMIHACRPIRFSELTSIVSNNRPDWRTALLNMKGIYLITLEDGRHYVGSAYEEIGLWNRWTNYVATKDGGNKELRALNKKTNGAYIDSARFTLIEAWPMKTYDKTILDREGYWKTALLSRSAGLNMN